MTEEEEFVRAAEVADALRDFLFENRKDVTDINLVAILISISGEIMGVNEAHGISAEPFIQVIAANLSQSRICAIAQERERIKQESH